MANLAAVCEECHIPRNHKPGGKLYNLKPKLKTFKGAAFMTTVRYSMINKLKTITPDIDIKVTYGAATKLARKSLNVKKTHSNDAYCMGEFHPKHRNDFKHYKKCRRNNRVLSKFYDAKYSDTRDGSVKTGSQLSCGRTNRSISRRTELNERIYRGHKISKGKLAIRRQHYQHRPGDIVWIKRKRYTIKGVISNGTRVALNEGNTVSINKIDKIVHTGGWAKIN